MKTYIENLTIQLDGIKQLMLELLDNSRIKFRNKNNNANIVIIGPTQHWDTPTEIEQILQIKIKKSYGDWIETFKLFTENSPVSTNKKIKEIDDFIVRWIEKKFDWGIPPNIDEAKLLFESKLKFYYEILNLYSTDGEKEIIVIPDTNALIQQPDPKEYKKIMSSERLTIIFLPTVLSELDDLKNKSSNPDFQKKVRSVITRLKGYRQQGNLINGVTVEKNIRLKMVASEPKFNKTLSWLDQENNDDRLVASALEIQRDKPSSVVCLVTSDINLQNKTEMAKLAYKDID